MRPCAARNQVVRWSIISYYYMILLYFIVVFIVHILYLKPSGRNARCRSEKKIPKENIMLSEESSIVRPCVIRPTPVSIVGATHIFDGPWEGGKRRVKKKKKKIQNRTERIISLGGGVTTAVTYAQKPPPLNSVGWPPPPPNKWLHFARQRSAAAVETAAVRRTLWRPNRGVRPTHTADADRRGSFSPSTVPFGLQTFCSTLRARREYRECP